MKRIRGVIGVLGMALLVACGAPAVEEVGRVAGTGVLDETVVSGTGPGTGTGAGGAGTGSPGVAAPVAGATETAGGDAGRATASAAPTTAPRKATTTTTSKPAAASSPAPDLEKLMVTAGPPGYERDDDEEMGNGSIDLDTAVEYEDEEDSEQFFRRHGFEAGWDRSWSRDRAGEEDDDDDLTIELWDTVYRFREAGGAKAYMDRLTKYAEATADEADGEEGFEFTTFSVDGVPGAKGYAGSHPEYGAGAMVFFTKGRYTVHIDSSEESMDKAKQIASSMARDQYSRL